MRRMSVASFCLDCPQGFYRSLRMRAFNFDMNSNGHGERDVLSLSPPAYHGVHAAWPASTCGARLRGRQSGSAPWPSPRRQSRSDRWGSTNTHKLQVLKEPLAVWSVVKPLTPRGVIHDQDVCHSEHAGGCSFLEQPYRALAHSPPPPAFRSLRSQRFHFRSAGSGFRTSRMWSRCILASTRRVY